MLSIAARFAEESTAVRRTISGKGAAAAASYLSRLAKFGHTVGAVQNQAKAPLHWSDSGV